MEADVATPNAAYRAMAADWELVHDLLGGTRIMRQRGERWLPREPGESREAYAIRLNRSILFNGLQRTLQTLVGKPLHRPAELSGMPEPLAALAGDVDLGGRNLTVFARDILQAALTDGVTHVLVDHPRQDDAETGGARPYLVHVHAADLIGWRGQENGIGSALTRIRIRESVNRPSGTWEDRTLRQIRVLTPGRFEVWRQKEDGKQDWTRADSGQTSLDVIPLVSIYANRTGFMTTRPPLMDLAWLNLAHWQSASDQRHILHVARVPILFGRNLAIPEQGLELGPNRIVTGDSESADLRYVEHSGAAIAAGRQDLIDLEDRMAVMGLDLMTRHGGNTTATARAIDAAESSTALLSLMRAVEDGLTKAFEFMGDWLEIPRSEVGTVILHQKNAHEA